MGAGFSTIGVFCSVRVWACWGAPPGMVMPLDCPPLPCSPSPGCPERVEGGHAAARMPGVIGEAGWRWVPPSRAHGERPSLGSVLGVAKFHSKHQSGSLERSFSLIHRTTVYASPELGGQPHQANTKCWREIPAEVTLMGQQGRTLIAGGWGWGVGGCLSMRAPGDDQKGSGNVCTRAHTRACIRAHTCTHSHLPGASTWPHAHAHGHTGMHTTHVVPRHGSGGEGSLWAPLGGRHSAEHRHTICGEDHACGGLIGAREVVQALAVLVFLGL